MMFIYNKYYTVSQYNMHFYKNIRLFVKKCDIYLANYSPLIP
jgi:hypothetical protein